MRFRDWFDDHKLLVYFLTSTCSVGVWVVAVSLLLNRASTAQTTVAIGIIILCYTVVMGLVTVTSCVQDSITELRSTMIEELSLTRAMLNGYLRSETASQIVREAMREIEGEVHAEQNHH